MLITMANLLETNEIKRETVDNLISDQYTKDVIPRSRSFILECPDCKKKFRRRILLLQHREVHKGNRKLLHSRNKKKQRKRRPSDGPTNNTVFNCEEDMEKLNCNTAISDNEEVKRTEHKKLASLKCKTQPSEEIKDEFECSEYTLTPFTHNEVHIKKYSVEEDESKHNDKSKHEKRKHHQVKDSALLPFQCEICDRTFSRKYTLTIHLRIHTGEKPFECKICFSRYKTKPNLIQHTIRQHPEDNPYKCKQIFECDVCQKKFLYKWDVMQHRKTHTGEKRFMCSVCQKGYCKKIDFVQHLKSHTGNFIDDSKYPSFTCEVCNKTFTQKGKLTHHLRSHTDDRPFQCKICSLRFKTKPVLVKHNYRQHPEDNPYDYKKDYRCDVCQKKFLYQSDLVYHRKIHTKPFSCNVCKKGFWKKPYYLKHLESHSGKEREKDENLVLERCSEVVNMKDFADFENHDGTYAGIKEEKTENIIEPHSKVMFIKEKLNYNNDLQDNEEVVVCTEHEKKASLRCEAQAKEEIKIEVKDEFECGEYTLQPFTYHGVHIEKDAVEESLSKHNDKRKRHQVKDSALPLFQCEICDRTFVRKDTLTIHLRIHTGEKPFECRICNKTFRQKRGLTEHFRRHSDVRLFQCKICYSRFKTKMVLVKHSIIQHPENNPYEDKQTFECDVCQKKFLYKSDVLSHKRIHTKEKPFNCAVCKKGYWKKPQLVQHLKSHTGNEKDCVDNTSLPPFQCKICDRTFARKDALTIHLRNHTGEKPFECRICNKTFTQKRVLTEHLRSHSDVRLFQCKICFSRFKKRLVLVRHSITQHPENNPYEGIETFDCDVCQKKFLYNSDFLNHKRVHTKEKPFNCAVCQKGYWNKVDLVQHLKSHTGNEKDCGDNTSLPPFQCEICDKTFVSKYTLTRHLRIHTGEKPFECKICFSRYRTKTLLIKHNVSKHPEHSSYECGKSFECNVCHKKFIYKSDYFKHKKFHAGERSSFPCEVCNKTFIQKNKLTEHLRSHTGERPFQCKICFSRFMTKRVLVKHSYIRHPEDNPYECKPSFECDVCQKKFLYKSDFFKHKSTHTDDRPFQCKICSSTFKTKPLLVKHSYKQHPKNDCKKDYRCDVCQKKFLYKSDMVYHRKKHAGDKYLESHSGNEREKDENLVPERCSEENASLQCEARTKEEMKIEVKDEFECGEYTLQPFTYHGVHIENNGVEEYESKHKCDDVHEERKHQVVDQIREDVTDSESRDHCYVEDKLEKAKFNEPYLEVVDIKEDTDCENDTS